MAGSCEHDNESLNPIKVRFLDKLSYYQILKNSESLPDILKLGFLLHVTVKLGFNERQAQMGGSMALNCSRCGDEK